MLEDLSHFQVIQRVAFTPVADVWSVGCLGTAFLCHTAYLRSLDLVYELTAFAPPYGELPIERALPLIVERVFLSFALIISLAKDKHLVSARVCRHSSGMTNGATL